MTIPPSNANRTCSLAAPLADLLEANGMAPVSAREISTAERPGDRRTYRVDLVGGGVVKGRAFAAAGHAARIANLAARLPAADFAAVLAAGECAVIEQWVAGTVLDARVAAPGVIAKLGVILGRLHATPLDAGGAPSVRSDGHLVALQRSFTTIADSRLLDHWSISRALDIARGNAPATVELGLTHNDLAPDNVVSRDDGALTVVDNELVSIDALDSDLGRTWWRWPMPPDLFAAFLAGYSACRADDGFRRHFRFWSIYTAANACAFHIAAGREAGAAAVARFAARLDSIEAEHRFLSGARGSPR